MRGTLRWARADLRARRGQALLTVGVVAGMVADDAKIVSLPRGRSGVRDVMELRG